MPHGLGQGNAGTPLRPGSREGKFRRPRTAATGSVIVDDRTIDPPRRSRLIDVLDMVIRGGRQLGVFRPTRFDKQHLMSTAVEKTGLEDFGDPWFERPFEVLLDAVKGEARLNAAGEVAAEQQLNHVLRDRLLAQMWFERHPEILARPIPHPVVIVGPMRSGTTRLHRLLAADRRFAHLRSFETISPVPRPGFEDVMAGRAADFRPVLARRIMKVARLANPRTLSIHPTGPYEPEEELGLLVASMWGMKHEAQWAIPSYSRWSERQDATPAYRHMANLLRLIGWSQQESSLRPWILKTPQHMLDLPALLKVFPDLRLIFTHRDPRKIVGSAASLAWNQTVIYSDHADPDRVGREWLNKTALMTQRMIEARRSIDPKRYIDVQYDAMERDWKGTMARVYRFLGLEMHSALPGMEHYIERSRNLKRHPHRYSLEEFGIDDGEVLERMAGYVRRFDVPVEGARIPSRRLLRR